MNLENKIQVAARSGAEARKTREMRSAKAKYKIPLLLSRPDGVGSATITVAAVIQASKHGVCMNAAAKIIK